MIEIAEICTLLLYFAINQVGMCAFIVPFVLVPEHGRCSTATTFEPAGSPLELEEFASIFNQLVVLSKRSRK